MTEMHVGACSGALPVLAQMLASATLTDVQDAIGTLIAYAKFGIVGAPEGLRRMLPLVFSREQGARTPRWTCAALSMLFVRMGAKGMRRACNAGFPQGMAPPRRGYYKQRAAGHQQGSLQASVHDRESF